MISTPMLFRPLRAAARLVVPVPRNGSRTVSPTKLNIRTNRSANSDGKGAGCNFVEAPTTSVPHLSEPLLVIFSRDDGQQPHCE